MFTRALSNQFTSTVVLSLFNVSAFIGQIVIGHLTDRIPYPTLMAFSAVISGIGAFVLWGLADATIYLYFFAIVFGSLVRTSVSCLALRWTLVLTLCTSFGRVVGSRRHGRTRRTSARGARRSIPGSSSTGSRLPAASL